MKSIIIKWFIFWFSFFIWIMFWILAIYAVNWSNLPANVTEETILTKDLWNDTINTLKQNIDLLNSNIDSLTLKVDKKPIFYWERTAATSSANVPLVYDSLIDNYNWYSNWTYTIKLKWIYEVCATSWFSNHSSASVVSYIRINGVNKRYLMGTYTDSTNRWQRRSYNCWIYNLNVWDEITYVPTSRWDECTTSNICSLEVKFLSAN